MGLMQRKGLAGLRQATGCRYVSSAALKDEYIPEVAGTRVPSRAAESSMTMGNFQNVLFPKVLPGSESNRIPTLLRPARSIGTAICDAPSAASDPSASLLSRLAEAVPEASQVLSDCVAPARQPGPGHASSHAWPRYTPYKVAPATLTPNWIVILRVR